MQDKKNTHFDNQNIIYTLIFHDRTAIVIAINQNFDTIKYGFYNGQLTREGQ